jgi:hypothetical protein
MLKRLITAWHSGNTIFLRLIYSIAGKMANRGSKFYQKSILWTKCGSFHRGGGRSYVFAREQHLIVLSEQVIKLFFIKVFH